MFRHLLAIVWLSLVASAQMAKIPRPIAKIPIHTQDPKKSINLNSYRGKIVMVILFLTDCDDCLKMVNFASQLQNEFGPRGFQAVGAAVDPIDKLPYLIGAFVNRYRPGFPIGYLIKQDEIMSLLGLPPDARPFAPMLMFIDHTGTVRYQYYGRDKAIFGENYGNLRLIVENLLRQRDEHKVPNRVTTPVK